MIDTSLICGLGVAPFLFGIFMPTVNFAFLLMIMLFTALLGDLILLPAILAGPAGILFRAQERKRSTRRLTLENRQNLTFHSNRTKFFVVESPHK